MKNQKKEYFGLDLEVWEKNILSVIQDLASGMLLPDILIIHVGGNNIDKVKMVDLLWKMKYDLSCLKCVLPNAIFIFS